MPREIPLTKGYVTIVDDCDYDELMKYNWHAQVVTRKLKTTVYAARGVSGNFISKFGKKYKSKKVLMHTHLMGIRDGFMPDHVSRDSLDNRRCNLRWATRSENCQNKKISTKTMSSARGVFQNVCGNWRATITANGVTHRLGTYKTREEAAKKYDDAATELHGRFAVINSELPQNGGN